MKLKLTQVDLKKIDVKKKPYSYSDDRYDETALLDSIRSAGILNPPIFKKKGRTFQIITGLRRIKAAKKLKLDKIPAYVTEKISSEEAFKLSILENQTTRTLNSREKANLLKKLGKTKISEKKIVEVFMPLLGLSPSKEIKDQLLAFNTLPKPLVDFALEKNLPLRRVNHLKNVPKPSLKLFSEIVRILTPGASTFEEITKGLADITKIEDKKLEEVAASLKIHSILEDESRPKEDRLKELREKVHKARFPILSKINRQLEQEVKDLDLPSFVNIDWDRRLEKKEVGIRISAKEKGELKKALDNLSDNKLKETLEKFLEKL